MRKKLLALFLTLMLLLSCGAAALADGPERTADIVILFTNDVHCGVDQGFTYAGVQAVRDYHTALGDKVFMVDSGDSIQGEPIGTLSKGSLIIDLMNTLSYDVAIPGNHEFDYGMENFLELTKKAKFPYVCCNFTYNDELVFEPYVIKEADGVKVAFVGICTPKSLVTSTPKYFQDEAGNYVYGFCQDKSGEGLYQAVQSAVDAARAEGADYVIALAHLGNEEECRPWTYADVISNTTGIDAMLDGHSHDTDQVIMKNKEGVDVPRSSTGTKLGGVGWCRIGADGKVTAGLYTWNNPAPVTAMLGVSNEMSKAIDKAKSEFEKELSTVVARTDVALTVNDPTEKDDKGMPVRMVRRAETNLGDFCADAYRDQSGADIGVINGGGVRADIPAGDITYESILKVHPFGNTLCVIEVTGQQVLDALEWASRNVPSEQGSFLQVSGLSFEIHSYLDSPCLEDENGMCSGFKGERRVKNVKVGDKELDPKATYTLAGTNYTLLENGGGYTAFDGSPLLQDRVKLDNQVLIDYITETLGGTVGEAYADPYGQGRIVIVETKP